MRGRRTVPEGVLRPRADAPAARRLRQPVAAGVSGADGNDAGDGSRVHRRVSHRRCCCRRGIRPAAHRHDRSATSRSIPADSGETGQPSRRARRSRADDLGEIPRSSAHSSAPRPRSRPAPGRGAGHRRPAAAGVRRAVDAELLAGRAVRDLDLEDVAAWCPRCFVNGAPAPAVAGLDTTRVLDTLTARPPADVAPYGKLRSSRAVRSPEATTSA